MACIPQIRQYAWEFRLYKVLKTIDFAQRERFKYLGKSYKFKQTNNAFYAKKHR